jgi:hypothetical protein
VKKAFIVPICLIVVLGLAGFADAAGCDVSFWVRPSKNAKPTYFPWSTCFGESGLMLDARYNYDFPGTGTFSLGRSYKVRGVELVPHFGVLAGQQTGVMPELYVIWGRGRWTYFGQNQYVHGVGTKPISFAYHWSDIQYRAASWLGVGFNWQNYVETKNAVAGERFVAHDVGPVVKLYLGKNLYARAWWLYRLGPDDKHDLIVLAAIGGTF